MIAEVYKQGADHALQKRPLDDFARLSIATVLQAVASMLAEQWEQMRDDDEDDALAYAISIKQSLEDENRVKIEAKLGWSVKRSAAFESDEEVNAAQMLLHFPDSTDSLAPIVYMDDPQAPAKKRGRPKKNQPPESAD